MLKTIFGIFGKQIITYIIGFIILVGIIVLIYKLIFKKFFGGVGEVAKKVADAGKKVADAGKKVVDKISSGVGRGVGKPIHTCSSGDELDAGLCYPKCQDIDGVKTGGAGPVCWQKCPPNFRDDGAFCAKPEPYGRGVGRIPDVKCPPGFQQQGIGNASWCDNGPRWDFWNLKTQNSVKSCRQDEEMNGGLCYPKCKSGYHAVGCCICSPDCPQGFGADIGVSCTKKTKGRGVGKPMVCADNEEYDAGLCYPKCDDVQGVKDAKLKNPELKFKGVGPVCWPQN